MQSIFKGFFCIILFCLYTLFVSVWSSPFIHFHCEVSVIKVSHSTVVSLSLKPSFSNLPTMQLEPKLVPSPQQTLYNHVIVPQISWTLKFFKPIFVFLEVWRIRIPPVIVGRSWTEFVVTLLLEVNNALYWHDFTKFELIN